MTGLVVVIVAALVMFAVVMLVRGSWDGPSWANSFWDDHRDEERRAFQKKAAEEMVADLEEAREDRKARRERMKASAEASARAEAAYLEAAMRLLEQQGKAKTLSPEEQRLRRAYARVALSAKAESQELRIRKRNLMYALHPSRFPEGPRRAWAEEEFKAVNEAFQIIEAARQGTTP